MKIRKRVLPEGWYPSTKAEIHDYLSRSQALQDGGNAMAGIVPHAGWAFCGTMISQVVSSLEDSIETIVVLGGHNPSGGELISYSEDQWRFPSGDLLRDTELMDSVEEELERSYAIQEEHRADNTVEVVLAMAAARFPEVKWAAWRVPADVRAVKMGEALEASAQKFGKRIAVLGSTDLTHYGPNYGFMPTGSHDDPAGWSAQRDHRFLEALASFDGEGAIALAQKESSACSSGGAAATAAFAHGAGCTAGRIVQYSTSRDVMPSSSFVGYGTILWAAD